MPALSLVPTPQAQTREVGKASGGSHQATGETQQKAGNLGRATACSGSHTPFPTYGRSHVTWVVLSLLPCMLLLWLSGGLVAPSERQWDFLQGRVL